MLYNKFEQEESEFTLKAVDSIRDEVEKVVSMSTDALAQALGISYRGAWHVQTALEREYKFQ